MSSLVSVITPVYNRKDYIIDCVNSVLSQTYQNFEIIIVDDGSTDGTIEVCKELVSKDSRIKLFTTEHICVSGARNIALEKSSGEYLFFLDSDDMIHPKTIEALVNGMKTHNTSISGTTVKNISYKQWDLIDNIIRKDDASGETECVKNSEAVNLLFRTITPINLIGGVMIRKDYIGDTCFRNDLFIGEDFYFVYENLIKGSDVVYLKPIWYYARIHSDNISNDFNYTAFWTRFYRRVLVWQKEEEFGRYDNVKLQKMDAYGCFTRCHNRIDIRSDDAKQMREAIKQYKKTLFEAFTYKNKISFILNVYFPKIYLILYKMICKFLKKSK